MTCSSRWLSLALLCLAGCDTPAGSELHIDGLAQSWELDEIDGPVDIEFFDGALYVLAGTDVPKLWRVDLQDSPVPALLPTEGLPAGQGRLLESSGSLLLVAGLWSGEVYSVYPSGEVGGAFRRVHRASDFVPGNDGALLMSASPGSLGFLIKATRSLRKREIVSGWGALPNTLHREVTRSDVSPLGDVLLAKDDAGRIHAAVNRDGLIVQYRRDGIPTLVSWLPEDMVEVGQAASFAGYGQPILPMINGFESSCDAELWTTVGRKDQRVAILDPGTYEVRGRRYFNVENFENALWAQCGEWTVGLSKTAGRVILGRAAR